MKTPFRSDEGANTEGDCQEKQKGLEDLSSSAHIRGKLLKESLFTKEFYEFVLPPVDMHLDDDKLTMLIDIPGFEKKDIKLSLNGNILSIQASKETSDEGKHKMICNKRPNIIINKKRILICKKDNSSSIFKEIVHKCKNSRNAS